MICIACGRRLMRAAFTLPATPTTPAGALGPMCARKAGVIKPRPQLFTVLRRKRVAKPTSQLHLEGIA